MCFLDASDPNRRRLLLFPWRDSEFRGDVGFRGDLGFPVGEAGFLGLAGFDAPALRKTCRALMRVGSNIGQGARFWLQAASSELFFGRFFSETLFSGESSRECCCCDRGRVDTDVVFRREGEEDFSEPFSEDFSAGFPADPEIRCFGGERRRFGDVFLGIRFPANKDKESECLVPVVAAASLPSLLAPLAPSANARVPAASKPTSAAKSASTRASTTPRDSGVVNPAAAKAAANAAGSAVSIGAVVAAVAVTAEAAAVAN